MEINTKNIISYVDLMKDLLNFNGFFSSVSDTTIIDSARVYLDEKCEMNKSGKIRVLKENYCFLNYNNMRIFKYNNEKNIVGLYFSYDFNVDFYIIVDLDISEMDDNKSFLVKDITEEEYIFYTDILRSFTLPETSYANANFSYKVLAYNDTVYDFHLNDTGQEEYNEISLHNKYGHVIGERFFKSYTYYENYISLIFSEGYYTLIRVKDRSIIDRLGLEINI